MNKNRVVWHEGLFLRPQHLQQQDRYVQHLLDGRIINTRVFNWGLTQLELDPQLLKLGKIAITNAQGVFPDGTPFDIPNDASSPIPYDVVADTKETLVYLAIPLVQPNVNLMSRTDEHNPLSRNIIKDIQLSDIHTDEIEGYVDIQVGELNVQLLTEQDKLNAYSIIPIARIVEIDKDKAVHLDESFIPAVMHCNSSANLMGFIKEVQGLLKHRGDSLASRLAAPGSTGVSTFEYK